MNGWCKEKINYINQCKIISSLIIYYSDGDNSSQGSVFIYIRTSDTIWTYSSKLIGNGLGSLTYFGWSISLSNSAAVLAIGAYGDNSNVGAVFTFIKNDLTHYTQESKLIGNNLIGQSNFGTSVVLSTSGNILAIGAENDINGIGSVHLYTRFNNTNFTAIGNKLVGNNSIGTSRLGYSIGLFGDSKNF